MLRGLVVFAVALLVDVALAQTGGILPNPGFDAGMDGWVFRPGDQSQVSLTDSERRGKILELRPDGKILGVEAERLSMGKYLRPEQAYRVEVQLKNDGIEKGVFAFSMYCFDEKGKSLKQIVFYGLNAKSAPHDWRRIRGQFGPGTSNPLPDGTATVALRFSFYEAGGDCRGKIAIDDVMLSGFEPPAHAGWPNEIIAAVGDLGVRFESRSFWTLYRIDYRGTRLCLDRWGSHYGTVASFPGVGFIGSGHTENEDEQISGLELSVDGRPVDKADSSLKCETLRLEKQSRIRKLVIHSAIEVRDNRILEEVRLKAEEPTPVALIYHFMHPWTFTATEFCGELPDGTRVEGEFTDDRGQKIDKAVRWSAIYDGPSGKGAVTRVLDVPPDDDWRIRYWDVPTGYRKHYLATFLNKTVPAEREFHYRVLTVPFEAARDEWKAKAARLAKEASP